MYKIYAYGGGDALHTILNGVAAFMHAGYLNTVILFSLSIGSVWFIVRTLGMSNALSVFPQYWMPVLALINVMFAPNTTVLIWDRVESRQYVVDRVPYFLGAFAGFSSQFGDSMREAFESLFSTTEADQYSRKGMVFASQLIDQTRDFKIVDETTRSNMKDFCRQCVVLDGLITRKYTLEELKASPDIWGMVKGGASPLRGIVWVDDQKNKTFVTCKQAAMKLESMWNQITGDVANAWGRKLFGALTPNSKNPKVELLQYLPIAYNHMMQTSKSATDWIQQIVMINSIKESHAEKYGLNSQEKSIIDRARAQYQGSWKAQAYTAAQYLPILKCILEGILYAFVLVILPLMLLPKGWVFIWNWVQTLFWIQLWPLTYAIVHFFLTHFAQSATNKIQYHQIAEGLTIKTQLNLVDTHWEFVAIAGMLMVSIPSLTFALIRGGAGQLLQIAGNHLAGGASAINEGLRELVSGNISWGNTQFGNLGWASRTLDQVNEAATINMGHNKWTVGNIERSTEADGRSIINAPHSSGPLNIEADDSIATSAQRQLMDAQTSFEQSGRELSNSLSNSHQNSEEWNRRWSQDKSLQKGVDQNTAASYSQALAKTDSINDKFSKESRISKELAGKILMAASKGVSFLGFKANLEASGSAQALNSSTYSKGQEYANSKEYKDAINAERSYAQKIAANTSNSDAKSLAESYLSTQNQMNSAAQNYSQSYQRMKQAQDIYSRVQTNQLGIKQNLNDLFIDWLAEQPLAGHVRMGRSAAEDMFTKGGTQAQVFAKGFKDQYAHAYLEMANRGASDIEKATEEAMKAHRRPGFEATAKGNIQSPSWGGTESKGFKAEIENTVDRGTHNLEDVVKANQIEANNSINLGRRNINQSGGVLKDQTTTPVQKMGSIIGNATDKLFK